jgi:nucleoid-associated protein YgaU
MLLAAGALLSSYSMGCGKPVLRVADASLGDYYSEDEFKSLSREQRDEYCNELALQDSMYQEEIRQAKVALAEAEARRAPFRTEVDSLLAEAERREQNIRTPETTGGEATASARRWNVRPGESLWQISSRGDVYGDGTKWRKIYEQNRGSIRDPDLIYPGQELRIP